MDKQQLSQRLAPFGQEHLLAFWDTLNDTRRKSLAGQIETIDFPLIERLYQEKDAKTDFRSLADRATSPPSYRLGDEENKISPDAARRKGIEALEAGRVAVILVAGGQGTRLGFDHPKGMFPIGPVSEKTIFQIHVEKIVAAAKRYGRPIPLCLMTSPATHDETVEFFDRNDRFGLAEEDLYVFCQGTLPAVDEATGRLLLAAPDQLALSPDGHGGTLAALVASKTLDALRDRGIEQIFYFQVDNPLVDVCFPEFIGYHLLSGSELTSQVVAKKGPLDRVGNVVRVDDHLQVIEYSDLDDDIAERRNEDGSLTIWAGSIAVHVFDVAFLARMADSAGALPFHVARKKVAHVDSSGKLVRPEKPNAIKFERFIFDLIPSARDAIVVEVDAARHFAPLKNATGHNAPEPDEDTAETVRAQLAAFYAEWLRQAGAEVDEGVAVEISPLYALDAEELGPKIEPGTQVTEARYFG